MKQTCHSTGHACSDVVPRVSLLLVGNDATGQFGTSQPDLSLFYSLNVKKDLSSTETVYTAAN